MAQERGSAVGAFSSSDRPLYDFQASPAVEDDGSVVQVGAQPPRLKLTQLHSAGDAAPARHKVLLQVDRDVAGDEMLALRAVHPDRPLDRHLLLVEVVPALVGG